MKLRKYYADCLIDPNQKLWYFPIYKNASTKITSCLKRKNWDTLIRTNIIDEDKFFDKSVQFAILRDPYERWISTFVSYIKSPIFDQASLDSLLASKNKDDFIELLFNWVAIREFHVYTNLQSESFLDHPDLKKVNFFWLNGQSGYQLNKWFQSHSETIPLNNSIENALDKTDLLYRETISFLFNYKNHKIKDKIMDYLQPDYDFISGIDFYAR
jgi:hypothetical protein